MEEERHLELVRKYINSEESNLQKRRVELRQEQEVAMTRLDKRIEELRAKAKSKVLEKLAAKEGLVSKVQQVDDAILAYNSGVTLKGTSTVTKTTPCDK